MAANKLQWKRIAEGDRLPCQSFLRKKDGQILKLSTVGGVKVGQDCYYLPVDDVINIIKDYPVEESEDERIRTELIDFLEYYRLNNVLDSNTISLLTDSVAWLEKQGKEILANSAKTCKNEPKFKVGDWINGYYTNYKVILVKDNRYIVEDVDGHKINIIFENEKFHRLWAMQDAKDGDVLYYNNLLNHGSGIMIYKKEKSNEFVINKYCSYNELGFEVCSYIVLNDGFVSPATKKQRDLLFQKMHEAGYEWDSEKKELKKLMQ